MMSCLRLIWDTRADSMKLPKALTKNLIERLAILTIVVYGLSVLLIFFPPFLIFDLFSQETINFEMDTDSSKLESIELVNWFNELEPGDYLIYKTIDPKDHPDLPQALADIDYKALWSEPIGPNGDCFRLVTFDQIVSFVCQNGYAQYDGYGQQIDIGYSISAKGKQFKTLWDTYKNP